MTKLRFNTTNFFDLLLDFDVIAHIICNKHLFKKKIFRNETNFLKIDSEEILSTKKKGFLLISLNDDKKKFTNLVLTDVLYASRFKFNFISIRKFDKKKIAIHLMKNDEFARLMYKNKAIGLIKIINDQYILQIIIPVKTFFITSKTFIQTGHERFDHFNYQSLFKLNQLIKEIIIEEFILQKICGSCMMGKQQRKINRFSKIRSFEILRLIHNDIKRPFSMTRFGERYYIIMKNDFIEAVGVYLLKTKN